MITLIFYCTIACEFEKIQQLFIKLYMAAIDGFTLTNTPVSIPTTFNTQICQICHKKHYPTYGL